jgi:hypothetical protein
LCLLDLDKTQEELVDHLTDAAIVQTPEIGLSLNPSKLLA